MVAQSAALEAQQTALDLDTRRIEASIRLIKAVGGGWTTADLPHLASDDSCDHRLSASAVGQIAFRPAVGRTIGLDVRPFTGPSLFMFRLTVRIDFENDKSFGPGKARLLELIEQKVPSVARQPRWA